MKTLQEDIKKVNENVIIATEQAMVDAGLFKCTPREGHLVLWFYKLNSVWNKMQWTPIMRVFKKPLTEDLIDDEGRVIEPKSTHKIDSFYGAPVSSKLDMRNFLESYGLTVEEL